jgi:hypothetical protein
MGRLSHNTIQNNTLNADNETALKHYENSILSLGSGDFKKLYRLFDI